MCKKHQFCDEVVVRMLVECGNEDGTYRETYGRINVSAEKAREGW